MQHLPGSGGRRLRPDVRRTRQEYLKAERKSQVPGYNPVEGLGENGKRLCLYIHQTKNAVISKTMAADSPAERAHWRSVLKAYDGYMQYHVRQISGSEDLRTCA